ncbi:small integral membrane protein 11-like [Ictalurus furcatus]|uniref:small integral membrane protein 11-like n=1 Tax=Ictalurus furcatus TaxID=66913 RepID=UPI0023500F7F|nr:small integral membrane protein 11-like [Ictalurus furcatus]
MINWRVLDNVPLLLYILAAKTLLLCLAFAGAKLYQQKKVQAELKQKVEAERKLAQETQERLDNKKDD